MQKQGTTSPVSEPRPPWTPLAVSVIAFVLPPGGAVLAVRNMARLRALDPRRAQELTIAAVSVFSIGFTILLVLAQPDPRTPADVSSSVSTVISIGTATASFLMLRAPYSVWRRGNQELKHGSWITALGLAVVYTLATCLGVVLIRLLIALAAHVFHWSVGQL